MKARAAAARARKKQAGTQSTRAAVRRLADGGKASTQRVRKSVQHDIKPQVLGKVMSKKKARRVRSQGTQSQTHRAPA